MSNGPLINVCPAVQIVIGATKIDIYTAYDTMIHGTEDIEPDTTSTHISTTYTDTTDVQKDIIDSIQKATMFLAADTSDIAGLRNGNPGRNWIFYAKLCPI